MDFPLCDCFRCQFLHICNCSAAHVFRNFFCKKQIGIISCSRSRFCSQIIVTGHCIICFKIHRVTPVLFCKNFRICTVQIFTPHQKDIGITKSIHDCHVRIILCSCSIIPVQLHEYFSVRYRSIACCDLTQICFPRCRNDIDFSDRIRIGTGILIYPPAIFLIPNVKSVVLYLTGKYKPIAFPTVLCSDILLSGCHLSREIPAACLKLCHSTDGSINCDHSFPVHNKNPVFFTGTCKITGNHRICLSRHIQTASVSECHIRQRSCLLCQHCTVFQNDIANSCERSILHGSFPDRKCCLFISIKLFCSGTSGSRHHDYCRCIQIAVYFLTDSYSGIQIQFSRSRIGFLLVVSRIISQINFF